jgi:ferredoxin
MVDPERFDLDTDNHVMILQETIEPDPEDAVQTAVRSCPTHALRIER